MTPPSAASETTTKRAELRNKRLLDQYSISQREFEIILRSQGGVCALCEEKLTKTGKNKGKPKPLNVDHDHKSGLTRGILCVGCNRKIPEWMTLAWIERVAKYLAFPPAVAALGEERYGRKGRVTNKRPRRATKRRKK